MEGTSTIATVLETVTSVVTASIGWMNSYISEVMSNPLILLFVCIPLVGLGIGLIRRMISL